jgi:SAM-dependent methyltransferase
MKVGIVKSVDLSKADQLNSLLEYHWLRPETALWRAADIAALAPFKFQSPSLDLGCGDGVFSFLRAGGRFDLGYDQFSHVGELDRFFEGHDIYNEFDPEGRHPSVITPPAYRFDIGLDHKQALLDKANMTGLYRDLRLADANAPIDLPDGQFATVFSNILYWLEGYRTTLREIARILRQDGRVYLHVPSDTFRATSFFQRLHVQTGDPMWAWLGLIDRNRSNNIKLCFSREEWTAEFEAAGLLVTNCRRYLSPLTLGVWDIGLRPLSPVLIEMANLLTNDQRTSIKEKWLSVLSPLVEPLLEMEASADAGDGGFFLFELVRA